MKMITVKGYKAFHGSMLVQLAPRAGYASPFTVGPCDWIYVPEKGRWYADNHSYRAENCSPILDTENNKIQVDNNYII